MRNRCEPLLDRCDLRERVTGLLINLPRERDRFADVDATDLAWLVTALERPQAT
jgi:hypothetical protein